MCPREPEGTIRRFASGVRALAVAATIAILCNGCGGGGGGESGTASADDDPCIGADCDGIGKGSGDEGASTRDERERPNILFITVDDQTSEFTSAFRKEGPPNTPNLEALAARGIRFTDGIAQGAQCEPSRNSLISGRYLHQIAFYSNKDRVFLPSHVRGFPRALQEAGYHTAFFGKAHVNPDTTRLEGTWSAQRTLGMQRQFGYTEVHQHLGRTSARIKATEVRDALLAGGAWEYGQDLYVDHLYDRGLLDVFIADRPRFPTSLPADDYMDGFIAGGVEAWLADYSRPEPFFLHVNFNSPHVPFDQPPEFQRLYSGDALPPLIEDPDTSDLPDELVLNLGDYAREDLEARRIDHASLVAYLDTQVGRVLDALEAGGFRENTLIVYHSDHGSMLGDHGLKHKATLYRQVLNANLVIDLPDTLYPESRKVVRHPVELLDAVQTVLHAAGVPEEARARFEGATLLPSLTDEVPGKYTRKYAFAHIAGATAVISKRWKYIDHPEKPVLFDRVEDPDELVNVFDDPDNAEVVAMHRDALARLYERTGAPMTACPEYPEPTEIDIDGVSYRPPPRFESPEEDVCPSDVCYRDSCELRWTLFGVGGAAGDAQTWCTTVGATLADESAARRFVTHLNRSGRQRVLDRAGWPRDGRPGFVATGGSSGMLRVTFDGDAYRIDTDAGGAGYPLCVR